MTFDSGTNQLVLFGGQNYYSTNVSIYFGDTWTYGTETGSLPPTGGAKLTVPGQLVAGQKFFLDVSGFDYSRPFEIHQFGQTVQYSTHDFRFDEVTVPRTTTPGTYRLWVTQDGRMVTEYYAYVSAFNPRVTPSSWYVPTGSRLTFTAQGFMDGETVRLLLDGKPTGVTAQAGSLGPQFFDNQGRITNALAFVVPASLAGQQVTFDLHGASSHADAVASVSIAALTPLSLGQCASSVDATSFLIG